MEDKDSMQIDTTTDKNQDTQDVEMVEEEEKQRNAI